MLEYQQPTLVNNVNADDNKSKAQARTMLVEVAVDLILNPILSHSSQ